MTDSREDIPAQLQQQAQTHIDKLAKELETLKEANKELAEKFQVRNVLLYSFFAGDTNPMVFENLHEECDQANAHPSSPEVEEYRHCLQMERRLA